jgi:hypothetical protein
MFTNLKIDPKTKKPIRITGPIGIKELTYIIRTRANIKLRSNRCERAYQRFLKMTKRNSFPNLMNYTYKLKPNNYPYNLRPELKHYILWYHGTWEGFEENYKNLCEKFNPELYWINKREHRSVETPHAHIIIKEQNVKPYLYNSKNRKRDH